MLYSLTAIWKAKLSLFLLLERLNTKDDLIVQSLTEKQQIYQEMSEVYGFEDHSQGSRSRLLLGDIPESLQGEALLKSAVVEGKCSRETCVCSLQCRCWEKQRGSKYRSQKWSSNNSV